MNRNEHAIVTGACGFIGSHLAEYLARTWGRVTAMSFYDARGSRGWLDDSPPDIRRNMNIVSGDVRDTEFVGAMIEKDSTVFHLAALIGIPYSYAAPRSYIDTNVSGTLNVLEAARRNGARQVLVVSTSEVYGTAIKVPIPEDHPLQGQSPYSASKIAAEKIAESFHRSFGLPVKIARPFNTFGPRQSPRAVIPTVLMQVLAGHREIEIGDPDTTRDFNFVDDTVQGLVRIAECDACVGKTVNIGTGGEISVSGIVAIASRIAGRDLAVRSDPDRRRPQASEVRRLCADNSLLKSLTGWTPPARVEEGMRIAAEWMKSRLDRYDTRRYYV